MSSILKVLVGLFILMFLPSCASVPLAPPSDIPASRQMVTVISQKGGGPFRASLAAWEMNDGRWHRVLGPWPAVIGRSGFAPEGEKREGDGRTPSGAYRIGIAFGREPALKTGLTYRQATAEDKWVDDAASPQYNQWVRGDTEAKSFEQMLRSDGLYDAGAVIEYNTDPVVLGMGSAIFLHIWRADGTRPTAGCVAISEEHVRTLLRWLGRDAAPVILLNHLHPRGEGG